MVRAGMSLPALQHLMGHSQIATTMLYVELAPQDVWREYARAIEKRTLLENGVDLSRALAAAKAIYGDQFDPATTVRALSYFADGDLPRLPKSIQNALQSAARSVELDELPRLTGKRGLAVPGRER